MRQFIQDFIVRDGGDLYHGGAEDGKQSSWDNESKQLEDRFVDVGKVMEAMEESRLSLTCIPLPCSRSRLAILEAEEGVSFESRPPIRYAVSSTIRTPSVFVCASFMQVEDSRCGTATTIPEDQQRRHDI